MAAYAILSWLQTLWPFPRAARDLKASEALVNELSIPDQTKQFVFAIRDPKGRHVVYILAVQNLSEQSALDTELLIKEVQPEAVVVIAPAGLSHIQAERFPVPTTAVGVLKGCVINETTVKQYEDIAEYQVLQEIFGVELNGHFLLAKAAAEEVKAIFLFLDSSHVTASMDSWEGAMERMKRANIGNSDGDCRLQPSSLLPALAISLSERHLHVNSELQLQKVKSLCSSLALLLSNDPERRSSDSIQGLDLEDFSPRCNYRAPSFARSVYSLLTDLHDIFIDLPAMGKALVYAQKMLTDVNNGDFVDTRLLDEVHKFQIAVESLRIGLNIVARSSVNKMESAHSSNVEFLELSVEEKSHVLLAHALKCQSKKFKSIVAIVDASSLGGLRKHWNTPVPQSIAELDHDYVFSFENDGEADTWWRKKKFLPGKIPMPGDIANIPVAMVAVGVGASAILVVPWSTFSKLITYKIPDFIKIGLARAKRTAAFALTNRPGPSKMVAPGFASYGVKTSALKVAASTQKLAVHYVIASVQYASFFMMQNTFYEIMRRRRRGQPVGLLCTTFGCIVATSAGLLVYRDGIQCAAESAPAAPRIARLGRGLESLHKASQEARQTNRAKIHEAVKSLMNRGKKKIKHQ